MTEDEYIFESHFSDPWPEGLDAMERWIRERKGVVLGLGRYSCAGKLTPSLPLMEIARLNGVDVVASLREFLHRIINEYGIQILLCKTHGQDAHVLTLLFRR